jgi:hypothetical protein
MLPKERDDKAELEMSVMVGNQYRDMVATPGWKDYKTRILKRIELTDKRRDSLGQTEKFHEWRAAGIEINVLTNYLGMPARMIERGLKAEKTLQERNNAKRA